MEWRINLDLKNFKPEFNLTHNLYTVTYVNLFQQHDNPWALLINFVVQDSVKLFWKRKPTNKQEFPLGKSNYCSVAIFFLLILVDWADLFLPANHFGTLSKENHDIWVQKFKWHEVWPVQCISQTADFTFIVTLILLNF